jgi:hypothetical protein
MPATEERDIESSSDDESDDEQDQDRNQVVKKSTKKEGLHANRPDDIGTCVMDTCKKINIKGAGFLFIIFMLITSTTFIDGCLSKYNGCVEGVTPSMRGNVIQGICLVIAFIVIDILIQNELI